MPVPLRWFPVLLLLLLLLLQQTAEHLGLRPLWQRHWQQLYLQQTAQQLQQHQSHLAQILSRHPQLIEVVLVQLSQQPALQQLWLVNRSGVVLFDSARREHGEPILRLPSAVAERVERWRQDRQLGLQQRQQRAFWLGQIDLESGEPLLLLAQLAPAELGSPMAQSLYQQMQRLWLGLSLVLGLAVALLGYLTMIRPLQRQLRTIDAFRLRRHAEVALPWGWHELTQLGIKLRQLFAKLADQEQRLQQQAQQLQLMYDHISDGVVLVDGDGRIRFANRRAAQIFAAEDAAALMTTTLEPELLEEARRHASQPFAWVHRLGDGAKRELWVKVAWHVSPARQAMRLFIQDRSAQVRAERQLRKQAFFDHSGIFNLAGLEQHWRQLSLAGANAELWIMVAVGIDRLRDINDSFGLAISDRLTHYVAANIKRLAPRGGICGRIARERYLIAYPLQQSREDPRTLCQQLIRNSMMRSMPVGGKAVRFSVSCGYVRLLHTHKFAAGMQRCLTALEVAQEMGLATVHHIDDNAFRQHSLRSRTLMRLHNAIAGRKLLVYIHPKLRLRDHAIVGGEALVRWRDQEGWISPADFIPMAERADIIHYIDQYMIDAVCRLLGELRSRGLRLKIAVNVSAKHFGRGEFRRYIRDVVRRHRIEPGELEIEITEYSLLLADAGIAESLALLSQLGISLAIDDFGTGASNLQSLIELPIEQLKIDKNFTAQLAQQGRGKPVVESIFGFARQLGIEITAEGIETERQCQILTELGCEYAQGFLFFKPMPVAEFIALVSPSSTYGDDRGSVSASGGPMTADG